MLFDLDGLEVPVFVVDCELDGRFRMHGMNAAAERDFGYPASKIEGRTFEECYSGRMVALLTERYRTCIRLRKAHQFDDYADLVDGRKWFRTTLTPCIDPQTTRVVRIMAISQNITTVMQLNERLEALAFTDTLTGMANRRRFDKAVQDACDEAVYSSRGFSLCVVDLDDLKDINDQFGHRTGDDVIRAVGRILCDFARQGELAARVGGDEFFMLLRALDRAELDRRLDVLRTLAEPGLRVSGFPRLVRLSVGGSVWSPGDEASDTLSTADAAMYSEKGIHRLVRIAEARLGQKQAVQISHGKALQTFARAGG